jgi:cyclin-dependent kinase 12/13
MSSHSKKATDIDVYRRLRQIGEGTYGKVYLCEEREERGGVRKQVAIKKVMIAAGKEGFPQTAVREIKLLALLRHENIVRLEHIVTPPKADKEAGDTIYMVFEYLDHDLAGLIRDPRVNFDAYQIKWFMKQLVEGLKHCHDQRVLHRDIKASNILIDNFGNLKLGTHRERSRARGPRPRALFCAAGLCLSAAPPLLAADFGLARSYSETCTDTKYSNKVITLWYRPPELLLGSEVINCATQQPRHHCPRPASGRVLGSLHAHTRLFVRADLRPSGRYVECGLHPGRDDPGSAALHRPESH